MDHPSHLLLLAVVGLVAGTLNTLAGGGSFLTLPALIFAGLPPTVANATNRVGVLLQCGASAWSFHRQGVRELASLRWAAAPATAGAVLGTWLALEISDDAFRRILAVFMVVVSLWTLWSSRQPTPTGDGRPTWPPAVLAAAFFGAGVYGGFVQAGVGFLLLAATTGAGLDLVRGNAVKVLAVLCLTALALAVFAWQGLVAWLPGLALAVGNVAGGVLGARLTVARGHRFVQRLVTVTILVFAVKLWWGA